MTLIFIELGTQLTLWRKVKIGSLFWTVESFLWHDVRLVIHVHACTKVCSILHQAYITSCHSEFMNPCRKRPPTVKIQGVKWRRNRCLFLRSRIRPSTLHFVWLHWFGFSSWLNIYWYKYQWGIKLTFLDFLQVNGRILKYTPSQTSSSSN